MKLIGRMTLMAVVFMITMSFGFMSPAMFGSSLKGATGVTGLVIELTDYDTTYEVGKQGDTSGFTGTVASGTGEAITEEAQGYKLPKPTIKDASNGSDITSSATVNVSVTNSAGRKQTVYKTSDGNYYLLERNTSSGVYTIIYTATNGSATTSTRNIKLEIVTDAVSFDFDENSPQIIPTIAYAGETIVFPKPLIVDEEGNEISNSTYSVSLESGDLSNLNRTLTQNQDGFYTYTVTNEDYGDFVVTYTSNTKGNNISQSFTFRVQQNEQDVTLEYSAFSQSMETFDLEVGVQATLPTPTVVNSAANDVEVTDVYTDITIYYIDSSAQNGRTEVYHGTDFEGFTPEKEGSYRIDYVTKDFHGHQIQYSIQRDNVRLTSSSITAKVVDDYALDSDNLPVEDLNIEDMENVDYRIPSVAYITDAQAGATVKFPAMYAEGWGDYSNLKLTRTIWNSSSNQIATLESTTYTNDDDEEVTYKANETASYTFTSAGKYEVRYRAQYVDDEGNLITGTILTLDSYTIEIKDEALPSDTNLTLSTPSVTTAVMKNDGETITFNAPVVSDDVDTNIEVKIQYTFASNPDDAGAVWYDAKRNDNGTYSIDVVEPTDDTAWESATQMTIRFTAYNDLYYVVDDADNSNFVVSENKVVQLINYDSDMTAPSLVNFTSNISFDETTQIITVPTVTFQNTATSGDTTNISLVLYVLDSDGRVMDTFNARTGTTATISEFEYTPVKEGDYTFLYVATDQNDNVSTFSLTCNVDFTIGYSVTIDPISSTEYGEVIDLPSYIQITDNGSIINIADSNIILEPNVIKDQEALDAIIAGKTDALIIQIQGAYEEVGGLAGRIKCLEGDITIKAWAVNSEGYCDFVNNASATVTFNSTDSTAPTFKIENESSGSTVIGRYEFDSTNSSNNQPIEVPWFDATSIVENGSGVDYSTMKIELTYPNASTPFKTFTLEDLDTADGLTFTPDREGKIKVVYSISDYQGNTNTRNFTIEVGDVIAPEIIVADDAITKATKVGENFSIDLSKITFAEDADNNNLSKVNDLEVTVTLNGEEFTDWDYNDDNTRIEFTANTSGTYVISFNITDDADNVANTVTKTFTINADSPNNMNTTTVWGTVLIVVSLVILGLVIFFFVKPSKSKAKTTQKTTKTK